MVRRQPKFLITTQLKVSAALNWAGPKPARPEAGPQGFLDQRQACPDRRRATVVFS
jgi:hypothetical protein